MKADYAHRAGRVVQVVVARWPSVFAPCLQIRVGRFDSGPRLQNLPSHLQSSPHLRAFCMVRQGGVPEC